MGRIGTVKSFARVTRNGEKTCEVVADMGGRDIVTADVYASGGVDAPPVPGDLVVLVPGPGTGGRVAVGFIDTSREGVADAGEVVVVARDANGDVVSTVTQSSDGVVRIDNGRGYIELGAGGRVDCNGNFTVDA